MSRKSTGIVVGISFAIFLFCNLLGVKIFAINGIDSLRITVLVQNERDSTFRVRIRLRVVVIWIYGEHTDCHSVDWKVQGQVLLAKVDLCRQHLELRVVVDLPESDYGACNDTQDQDETYATTNTCRELPLTLVG